ncbi:hypothetical protein B566_EDAN014866, partial [Ephemera danica]
MHRADVPSPLMTPSSNQAINARIAAVRRAFALPPLRYNNSANTIPAIPCAPPPGMGPGADAGGGATGGMGGSMHHPGPTRPSQSPQSQQQAPALTSTPPLIQSQQQHSDINKQVSPHMQGQQVPPVVAEMLHHQQQLNSKLAAGFRPLTPPTNMTPQQIAFAQEIENVCYRLQVIHIFKIPTFCLHNLEWEYIQLNILCTSANMYQNWDGMFPPNMQYTPQGRGNSPSVHFCPPPALPYLPTQMMTSFGHNQQPPMYFANPMQMMRPNMSMQQPQQNTSHIGSPAPPQAQSQSSGIPGPSSGTPGPPMQEKKRRSHAIPIVHPETGKDLLDELCTEFAAKVAIAAGEDSKNARIGMAGTSDGRMPVSAMMMPGQVNGPSPGLVADTESSTLNMGLELQKQASPPLHQTKDSLANVNCKTSETWKSKSKATFAVPTSTDLDSQIERNRSKPAKVGYAAITDSQASQISSDNVNIKKVEKTSSVNQVKVFDASPKEGETAKTSGSTGFREASPPQSVSPVVGSPSMFCEMLSGTPNPSSINYAYSASSARDKDSPLTMMPDTPPQAMPETSPQMMPANMSIMCTPPLERLPTPPDTDNSNGEFDSD